MIEPNIYCKVCGMAMQCVSDSYKENKKLPLVVEIGCADGQGVRRYGGFCRKVICIDPMVGGRPDIDVSKKEPLYVDEKKIEAFSFRTFELPVDLIVGCSLWPQTLIEFKKRLNGEKIDVLIIDGCHHPFEAVWGDFQAYYPFVAKGGYVIFDDLYEECIDQAYKMAIDKNNMIEHDRWSVNVPGQILQDVGALKKTED